MCEDFPCCGHEPGECSGVFDPVITPDVPCEECGTPHFDEAAAAECAESCGGEVPERDFLWTDPRDDVWF